MVVIVVFQLITRNKFFAIRASYENYLLAAVADDDVANINGLTLLAGLAFDFHR